MTLQTAGAAKSLGSNLELEAELAPAFVPTCAITELSAALLSQAIHSREVSCAEVMTAYLKRQESLNSRINALVSMVDPALLLAQADQYDEELKQGKSRGWMHGIPQAIKDITAAKGLPWTSGSLVNKNLIAPQDSLMASRLRAAGSIFIGKTNVPEFGLGSHSFNEVFGVTRNPFDPSRSAGGSSGGAAAAVAAHLLPVADGSDMMGSLRNPAAWASVFGMRPSQGRIPTWPVPDVWTAQLATDGPIARTVQDLALLLKTQSGFDPRAPLSLETTEDFSTELDALPASGLRIGWLGNLQGYLPCEEGILPFLETGLSRLQKQGCQIEAITQLGFSPANVWETWLVWRKWVIGAKIAENFKDPANSKLIKPEAIWEYEQSLDLTATDVSRAAQDRTTFYQQIISYFERFDVLALPATQCWPFPVEWRWPKEVAGQTMDTYHRWMECVIYGTLAGLPCASVPMGLGFAPGSNKPLPVGLQLIGKPRGDKALLQAMRVIERTLGA